MEYTILILLLPFEVISLLLLACIVGGILIARKR